MEIEESLSEIIKEWLEAILFLERNSVMDFGIREISGLTVSQAAVIDIHYNKKADNSPESVFIKITNENTRANMPGYGEKGSIL